MRKAIDKVTIDKLYLGQLPCVPSGPVPSAGFGASHCLCSRHSAIAADPVLRNVFCADIVAFWRSLTASRRCVAGHGCIFRASALCTFNKRARSAEARPVASTRTPWGSKNVRAAPVPESSDCAMSRGGGG